MCFINFQGKIGLDIFLVDESHDNQFWSIFSNRKHNQQSMNAGQKLIETVFSIAICCQCFWLPFVASGRQMAIENTVSIDFWSTFPDSIGVFDCRLPGVVKGSPKSFWMSVSATSFCDVYREYKVSAFWYQVYQARLWERLLTSRGLPSDSTCVLKAEPGKLDIKRREPGILFISLLIVEHSSN